MKSSTAQSTFLGANLTGIADWSTQYPFLDYFKSSRDWVTHTDSTWNTRENDKLRLDDDGWVTSLDGGRFTSVGTLLPNDNQGRRFVVSYEGEGTIQYLEGARKDNAASKPGRDVFYAEPGENINLRITETDPKGSGNYLRNIRVVPEEYEAIAGSQTFNPDFLESLEGYKTLRFMDWMDTNHSEQGRWGNRPEVDDANYVGEGTPVEVMVELANETGIDPWFTLPHKATDDYVRNFAQYVKKNLDPDRKVYVEFSNEVWNGQFEQARYAREQGKRTFPSGSDYESGLKWFGQRTGQITQIWDDVFGGEKNRVVGVLGAHGANPFTAEKSLEALRATGKSYEALGIDAVAIAPYFGGYIGSPKHQAQVERWARDADGGLGKLFKEITQGGVLNGGAQGGALQLSKDWMTNYAKLADKAGLDLVAYEGGQHLVGHGGLENNRAVTDLFIKANRDPRIGKAYQAYFENWQEVSDGGVFANFSDFSKPSKYGSWGIRESLYQDSSPKFNAIQDILDVTGVEPDASPPAPAPVVFDSDPAVDEPDEDMDSGEDTGMESPEPETPDTDMPEAEMPEPETPEAEMPEPEIPEVETPELETPEPEMPEPETPDAEMPEANPDSSDVPDDASAPPVQESGDGDVSPDLVSPDSASTGPIRIEAEDMTLEGYRIEANDKVSGERVISFLGEGKNESGTASQTFDGPSGTYDIVVSYVEETDGIAALEATLNGESLDQWQLTQDLGSATISRKNQVQRTVAAGQSLESGDTFELQGNERGSEHARVDYVEFIPVDVPADALKLDAPASPAAPSAPLSDAPLSDTPLSDAPPVGPAPVTLTPAPIQLSGNALQGIALDYTITPDTMMQLEFRRGSEGAIQAIAFDQDVFLDESDRQNMFKLSGTEDWAVAEDLSDQVTNGQWQTLDIAVGQHVTGDYNYLSLLNIDGGMTDATSEFRNVKLYESSMGAMTSERGVPFDDTAMDENPLAALATEDAVAA